MERRLEFVAGAHALVHRMRLRWDGPGHLQVVLAEEWGLGVFGGRGQIWAEAAGTRLLLHDTGELPASRHVAVAETHSGLSLAFRPSVPAAAWSFPLVAVSNSEAGFERTDQGAVLLLRWPLDLAPGQIWEQATRAEIAGPWIDGAST